MRYERVEVKRDTQTTYVRDVPLWEIPLLEFIFEDGNVKRTRTFVEVAGEYPDAALEFQRLAQAYGSDPKSDVPHVAAVFGEAARGVRELRKLIDEAKAADAAAKPRAARKRKFAADPLMV